MTFLHHINYSAVSVETCN